MIDRSFIGAELPVLTVEVEAGRLRAFAKASGQADPIYLDRAAARQAGHDDIPVPPTFLFCMEGDAPDPAALREMLNLDFSTILHGEQHFSYRRMAHAGDRLTFAPRIVDIYARKAGALEFVVRETRVTDERGDLVAELLCITVVRNS